MEEAVKLFKSLGNGANNIKVAKMGKIEKFYPETMSADVMPLPAEDNSLVQNVPIATMRCEGYIAFYPIKSGDKVLLVFADNDTDNLKLGGDNSQTERQHDISDAFCIGGLTLLKETLNIVDTDAFVIQNISGDTSIALKDGEVTIKSDSVKVESSNIELVGHAKYRGREIAVKGDSTSDGASIV